MTTTISRRHLILAAPVLMTGLGGCAATSGVAASGEGGEAALLERAKAYWALIRNNDRVGAWAYEELSKDPNATLEAYLKRGGIAFEAVEVRSVKSIEGDRAVVNVWMRYSLPLLRVKRQESTAEDEWRKIGGVWHHVQRRSSFFPTPE